MEFIEKSRLPGPNRRCDSSILEYQLRFAPGFAGEPDSDDRALQIAIHSWSMATIGHSNAANGFKPPITGSWLASVAQRFAELALQLQQAAGHRVAAYGVQPDSQEPAVQAWFEYDHPEVGERAAVIALAVIRQALGLGREEDAELSGVDEWHDFLEFAQGKSLPLETRALVAAAARRGIPCFKLDRYPYDPLQGDFRIRPNGLLRLGHGCFQYVLDGTLCVNLKPLQTAGLSDSNGLRRALQACGVRFDAEASGPLLQVLALGGEAVAALEDGIGFDVAALPLKLLEDIRALHRYCDLPIFAATIAAGGTWVGLELAPRLETWFAAGGPELDRAADRLLAQLYPAGSEYRIPIISVTGTNGKTTTCTMLRRIMIEAGRTPVTVCSNGVFVGDQGQGSRRDIGPAATYYALESNQAEVAVFEDYFGSINRFGFAYEWSDVAVCTNVTADHLHRMGVHTLQEMAEVKFSVIARAQKGVVLNADNDGCAGMLARATAEKRFAVSMTRDRRQLAIDHPAATHFMVLEMENGEELITLYAGDQRWPLVAVDDIPATRQGQARHNTSNAMHAAAAAWVLEVAPARIAAALQGFVSDFASCPGRLNEFAGLPYRVIMDYAHNGDGFRQVAHFVDQQQVAGRKIIMFSFSDDRRSGEIRDAVRELAGHFDLYACGKFREPRMVVTKDIPGTLRSALLDCGVQASAICVAQHSAEGLDLTLAQARPGDLVVLLVGGTEFGIVWQRLTAMRDGLKDHDDSGQTPRAAPAHAQFVEQQR